MKLDAMPGIEAAEWIAVRVIPDPDVAFLNHTDTCFDGVLIWPRVNASYDGGSYLSRTTFPSSLGQVVLNQANGAVR